MACKSKGSLKAWGEEEGVQKPKAGMLEGRFANWTLLFMLMFVLAV